MKGPCLNCADRKPMCWNDCEKYKEYKAQLDAVRDLKQKERMRKEKIFKYRGK